MKRQQYTMRCTHTHFLPLFELHIQNLVFHYNLKPQLFFAHRKVSQFVLPQYKMQVNISIRYVSHSIYVISRIVQPHRLFVCCVSY